MHCLFCQEIGGDLLWQDALCRVVLVDEPYYPGFCRVILNRHVKEMTDLTPSEQIHLMQVVLSVERAIREVINPDKINLASLGNKTPHVHWHVIPRMTSDATFPESIWSPIQRNTQQKPIAHLKEVLSRKLNDQR
jgi:diadenosine tetraphosphate (Ap4A) HIT family hydrolase